MTQANFFKFGELVFQRIVLTCLQFNDLFQFSQLDYQVVDVQLGIKVLRARVNQIVIFARCEAPTYAVDEVPQDGWGGTGVVLVDLVQTEFVEQGRVVGCNQEGE